MKTVLLIYVGLLFCGGCGPPMTGREKVLFGAMCAAQWADYETTRRCVSAGAQELNPALGDHPSDDSIALFKASVLLAIWGLGEIWPSEREGFYTIGIVSGGSAALWNNYNYENNR